MKRFFTGLVTGLLIGIILSTGVLVYASTPIKLIVNQKEIQCDVPPQIIDGRTLVPARFLAEALGARVTWDEKNSAVVVTTAASSEPSINHSSQPDANNRLTGRQFYEGVIVTKYSDGGINVKIDKDKLPHNMINFTKLSVYAVSNVAPETITKAIDDTIQFGYGLFPYSPEGYEEGWPSDLYLVLLFDDNNNFLGYYISRL